MAASPLKVLLAIEDRATLRHSSRLLAGFGHKVCSAASASLAAERLRADRPDVLVAGGGTSQESAVALCRALADEGSPHEVFKLLLVNDPTPAQLVAALEAGFDDFLASPLDAAELLARLRTAARVLEFERRLGRLEKSSGLLSRQAFLLRLQAELSSKQRARKPVACFVLQPDAYAELKELHGSTSAARAMHELAARVKEVGPHLCFGQIDSQRLVLALPVAVDEALARAEQLRVAVETAGFRVGEADVPWTVSLGVAIGEGDAIAAAQLLEQAEKALALAQQSGGNEVARQEDVHEEERRWSDLAGGRLFGEAVLRNFMVPCPRLLRTTDSLFQAETLLRQTRLPALPVVDEEGKLAGLLSVDRPRLRLKADSGTGTVSEVMHKEAISFDEATTLPVLIDYFTQEAPPVVVVVHKGRPTGLVTPASLGTLVEPLSTATFAPAPDSTGHSGLIVPHLCAAANE